GTDRESPLPLTAGSPAFVHLLRYSVHSFFVLFPYDLEQTSIPTFVRTPSSSLPPATATRMSL
ncbi:hypothetical protein, partial [Fibrobacter sp. UBA4297]|uniref:hypothetical protein n=1 Tax=Fibrobacter sp. UBA4297 TaxID=1946536 RepID=UPI0025B83B8D